MGSRNIRGGGSCLAAIRGDFLEEVASWMEKAFGVGTVSTGRCRAAWEIWEEELCAEKDLCGAGPVSERH